MTADRVTEAARDLLPTTDIDLGRSFLDHGGDSLGAIRLARRLEQSLGVEVDALDVIESASLRALGDLLASRGPGDSETPGDGPGPVTPLPIEPHYAASPVQQSLYLLDQMTAEADAVTLPTVLWYNAALDEQAAGQAFRDVLDRHEILRTTFSFEAGHVVQVVNPFSPNARGSSPDWTFSWTDARGRPEDVERELAAAYQTALNTRLDPAIGPVARLSLVVAGPSLTVGFLTLHHIVSDDFSAAVIDADFRRAYDHAVRDTVLAAGLGRGEPLPFQYRDYAHWLRDWLGTQAGRDQLAWWREHLSGSAGGRAFPAGGPGSPSFAAARYDNRLDEDPRSRVSRMARERGTTTSVILASCVKVMLLLRYGAPAAMLGVAVTTPPPGREDAGLTHVGPYVNTLPVSVPITGATTFRELARLMAEEMHGAVAHRTVPLEAIQTSVGCADPLFDVGFTLQKRGRPASRLAAELPAAARLEEHYRADSLAIRLLFTVFEEPDHLHLRIRYQTGMFSRPEITAVYQDLVRVVQAVSERPDDPVGELSGYPVLAPSDGGGVSM